MKLPSSIRFCSEKIRESFYALERGDDSERKLFIAIEHALNNIEENAFSGIQIPKYLIPKEYNTENLWKYNLIEGHRLLYCIYTEENVVISMMIAWYTHKEYERIFKY